MRRSGGSRARGNRQKKLNEPRVNSKRFAKARVDADEDEDDNMEDDREQDCLPEEEDRDHTNSYSNRNVIDKFANRDWGVKKPKLPKQLDPVITFQEIETDYSISESRQFQKFQYDGRNRGFVPVLQMYGLTRNGNSVCAHLWGFEPYFYVQLPAGCKYEMIDVLKTELEKLALEKKKYKTKHVDFITRVEIVKKTTMFRYQTERDLPFIKIVTGIPTYVPMLRSILQDGFFIPGVGVTQFQTYESSVLFTMRCMIDANLIPMTWIDVSNYEPRKQWNKQTSCDIEIDCRYQDAKTIDYKTDGTIGKFRILSFDIECLGYTEEGNVYQNGLKRVMFPIATKDECKVIVICNTLTCFGDSVPLQKTAFVLGGCDTIPDTTIYTFKTEEELLLGWASYIRAADPDIVTGYNIINFDFPYLFDRASHLDKNGMMSSFFLLGRDLMIPSICKPKDFQSKQMGNRKTYSIKIKGRAILDMLNAIQRDHKLSSYKLNNVSALFLGEQKDDVHYSMIGALFAKNDQTRQRVTKYCLQDTCLPQRLIDKLMTIYNLCEMARVCGLSISLIMERGQQIKVVSQILREAVKHNLVMPTITSSEQGDVGYQGATVFEPKLGFYNKTTIPTLDFASLYPSIMIAHNLCFTTLIDKTKLDPAHPEWYTTTPAGHHFVKSTVYEGLLPTILRNLLSARENAKSLMKTAKDPLAKAVYNGRQLALKVSANSVYGFTGAGRGALPCIPISASVTAFGRDMILKTKDHVETTYTTKNGYPANAVVIYGDTDSVMVNFGYTDIAKSMEEGKKAAREVSKIFIPPIKLEFEKVYFPYLLLAKKHYAGLLWQSNSKKHDKLDAKGIESVRRDKCGLVRMMVKHGLELVLEKRDNAALIRFLSKQVSQLLSNKIDIALLCQSKTISKTEYKSPQPHIELAKKMAKRDPASAPKLGDRVQFVYIAASNSIKRAGKAKIMGDAKDCERSEDPSFVLENGLSADVRYYLDNKIRPVIERTFGYVLTPKEMQGIFEGKHARKAVHVVGKNDGMAKFASIQKRCMSCKCRISKGPVCSECIDKAQNVYMELVKERNRHEVYYAKATSFCHSCQGALGQEVLCANDDCALFYMKKQVKMELTKADEKLQRFDELDW